MKNIGFPISHKENENRRAVIPDDLSSVRHCERLYFQKGYGKVLGYSDSDYENHGCHIVTREEALSNDIVCDPKAGDGDYLPDLRGQTVFGWIHAVQNKDITDCFVNGGNTAVAWEDMFEEGRHVFWRNNEIAGEAAVMHAFQLFGIMPYNCKVAVLGRGNVATGALKILTLLGADVTTYTKYTESLFRKELPLYDVVVNAILWDTSRTDHIVYRDDLKRMKRGAMIIDVSCDRNGGIETCIPTTIDDPVYTVDGILHYAVDHTPSLFYRTTTKGISEQVCKYLDMLSEGEYNQVLLGAMPIVNGMIKDKRIIEFQKNN